MAVYTDQTGSAVEINSTPQRIVSLVPSQTELLYDLGLEDEVLGITKFCVHPGSWFHHKKRVGGTKTVKTDLVSSLQPDLIIAGKEETIKEQVEALREIAPVWISDVTDLEKALNMIECIGLITGKQEKAFNIITTIQTGFNRLLPANRKHRTAYLIWKDPYMTVGGDTFIHDMLNRSGFENVFALQKRYPETTAAMLKAAGTELVLLSSEPYPFQQKHLAALQKELPGTAIVLVDGEMFSWYGSRMQYAAAYLQQLLENINSGSILPKS